MSVIEDNGHRTFYFRKVTVESGTPVEHKRFDFEIGVSREGDSYSVTVLVRRKKSDDDPIFELQFPELMPEPSKLYHTIKVSDLFDLVRMYGQEEGPEMILPSLYEAYLAEQGRLNFYGNESGVTLMLQINNNRSTAALSREQASLLEK